MQYTSHENGTFACDLKFDHITISPEYPQSNSFIERTIHTVKKTLKKALQSGDDPYLALLALHTTPLSHDKPAPATIIMNHQLCATLPTVNNTLQPTNNPSQLKAAEKSKANKPLHTLRPLAAGDFACFGGKEAWDCKGVILDNCNQAHSYNIVTDKGTTIHRNRRHLLQTKESIEPFENFDLLDFDQDDHSKTTPTSSYTTSTG